MIQARKIKWDTIIPQEVGTEVDTGIKFANKTVYAQRFSEYRNFTAFQTLDIVLETGIDSIIKAVGWVRPGSNLAKGIVNAALVNTNGSSNGISGGHYLLTSTTNELRLRFVYQTSGTMSYDIVCFYTKI